MDEGVEERHDPYAAGQVLPATQQLAQSSRVQREASEEVAAAVIQLQASVLQVRASLDSMLEGGRTVANQVRETARQAQAVVAALEAVVQRTEQAVESAQAIQTLAQSGRQILEGPARARHRAQAAKNQSTVSTEVSRRMEASLAATGAVQLAAAQLANTAPEVVLTARDLASVAEALKTSAAAFQAE